MSRPTRIIKQPVIVKANKRGAPTTMIITCDDGREYGIQELAQIVGFKHSHGLYQRLRNIGWDDPDALNPPSKRGYRVNGSTTLNSGGTGDWGKLSSKDRSAKLHKIKIGTWEKKIS
jgi:hypothetical protein